ncbi:MAG: DUF6056 family protein [Bacteroidales bacterium]|jgi:hypothetical protein|nr:DUF6056 family protein [Bacteroidales bacterium]
MKINKSALLIGIASITFVLVLLMNFLTPVFSDDFTFAFNTDYLTRFEPDYILSNERIASMNDVFVNIKSMYFYWSGRVIANSFAFIMSMFDKSVFNVVNSLFFIALIVLMYLHIARKGEKNVPLFLLITVLMFVLQPTFGMNMLWLSGSCNYLWTMVFILLFLLPFKRYATGESINISPKLLMPAMFLLGLVAGCTMENMGLMAIAMSMLFIVIIRMNKQRIPPFIIAGLIGVVIGYVVLIAAPGNYVRAAHPIYLKLEYSSFISKIIHRVYHLAVLEKEMWIFNLILLFAVAYAAFSKTLKSSKYILLAYVIGGFVAYYSLAAAPNSNLRAGFPATIITIIVAGQIYMSIKSQRLKYAAVVLSCALAVVSIVWGVRYLYDFHNKFVQREAYISSEKAKGNKNIKTYSITSSTIYRGYWEDIYTNKHYYFNRVVARYYGLKSIEGTMTEADFFFRKTYKW